MPESNENVPEPPIHRAARLGDVAELARLLEAGADVNERADVAVGYGAFLTDLTPLTIAARSVDGADVATLRFLIERGADMFAASGGDVTAAWYAAGTGEHYDAVSDAPAFSDHAERLRLLLDAGLDAQESAWNGRSLIVEASASGDPARVQLLLERGASASPPRKLMDSFAIPIFCAAASGSAECVRLLLAAGADPNEPDSNDKRPLSAARSPEVVQALLGAGAGIDGRRRDGADILQDVFYAISTYETPAEEGLGVAQRLLEAGVPLDLPDAHGWSRLYRAAFSHQDYAVEFLLRNGASTAPDGDGSTALHAICWQGEYPGDPEKNASCERIIRLLVAAGIPINAHDSERRTPLHKATRGDWGNVTAVRTLLALGAEVDPTDYRGRTPLHRAADYGELDCVETLLAAGADPKHADFEGFTPVTMAYLHKKLWEQITAERRSNSSDASVQEGALREANASYAALLRAESARSNL